MLLSIAGNLSRYNTSTLLNVNQMLDLLLKQQEMNELEKKSINHLIIFSILM